jgi:hypothetical protein
MKEGFTQSIGMCLGLIYGMSIGIATHNIGFCRVDCWNIKSLRRGSRESVG